jgi:hypothetical protein
MKRLICVFTLLFAAFPASGRYAVVFRLASPPLPVEAGQQFSLCVANVGTSKSDLTLQFINVRTGAVIKSRDLTLPPPGTSPMPDPCLAATADEVGAVPGEPPLLVALVIVRHGLFSRAAAATASVQVTGPQGRMVASIPLHVATLVNGRNTPIENVK